MLMELKIGKAGEPDGLKPELYKVLKESRVVVRSLKEGMEKLVEDGGEPGRLKESRTVMIPMKIRPTVTDLRPIELTDVSYVSDSDEGSEGGNLEASGRKCDG